VKEVAMEFDRLPTKPLIKSLASAQAEWDEWLAQNLYDFIRDGDGMDWRLIMKFDQLPSELDRHQGKWVATLRFGIDVPVKTLVDTGTLDREADARLIKLLGDSLVPLRMRQLTYETSSENEMREMMSRVLPELRENFRKTSLHQVKRDLVGRWLDSLGEFGARESTGAQKLVQEDEIEDL
jgi:hypothetical protein